MALCFLSGEDIPEAKLEGWERRLGQVGGMVYLITFRYSDIWYVALICPSAVGCAIRVDLFSILQRNKLRLKSIKLIA